jgi:hypothetical protein
VTATTKRLIPENTTITDEGRANRRNMGLTIAVLLAVGVMGWAIVQFGNNQASDGPSGSMFVTGAHGTAALAELLELRGNSIVPAMAPLTGLDSGGTVFVIDPSPRNVYSNDEIESIRSWIEDGGRFVFAGRPHPDLSGTILPDDLRLGFSGTRRAEIVTPIRGIGGIVETDGVFSAETDAEYLGLVGDAPMAIALSRGEREIIYIADSSILWNLRIGANAPWIVSIVQDGAVRFDEVRHGFEAAPVGQSNAGLLAALPPDIRTVLWLLAPVLGIGLVVYGRRLGPPEARTRDLAPPRRELVDAVAGLLARMPDPAEAARPIADRLRTVVTRGVGLTAGTDDDALVAASSTLGIDPARLETALSADTEDAMIAAQHLLAELSERERP